VRVAIAEEIVRQRELEARSDRAGENPMVDERHDEQPREEGRTNERVFEQTVFEGEGSLVEKEKIIRELEYKLRDEQIASRAKDIALNRMENERKNLLDQVVKWSHRVGVLETQLLQIEAPRQSQGEETSFANVHRTANVPNDSEQQGEYPERDGERGWQGNTFTTKQENNTMTQ
jgi:hypothetical protein